jgi:outer membrane protein assembly factor BamB
VAPDSRNYFFHGDPLITPDIVVIGADPATGGVHAFERSTGRQRWKYAAGHGVAGALAGLGRRAYAITLDGQLLSFDIESGAVAWSFPVEVWGWLGPGAAPGRVFVGARDGSLYALDSETGRVEWQTRLPAPVSTTVRATPAGLFVGTTDGAVSLVDIQHGRVLASRKIDDKLRPRGEMVPAGDSLLVLLADEQMNDRALVSVDTALTSVRWRQAALRHWSTSRVFVWGPAAVVGSPSGEVVAYCVADGTKAWSRTVSGTVRAIGGADDMLYVGTTDGTLYAIRPAVSCRAR